MKPIPPTLLSRPFTRDEARELGVTDRMLNGRRFVRVMPRVYRHRDLAMTPELLVEAARLALPDRALLTGLTRLQLLGLDFGPREPVRFVVEGDLHLAGEGIFLHRTKKLPPTDGEGATPAAAFIAYCRRARVNDAVKVGDWLLHHGHMTSSELRDLAIAQLWRDGAHEALWVLDHLDGDSRSLPESEMRALLAFAGLPAGEANREVVLDGVTVIGDLVLGQWRTFIEYEGQQHQRERGLYLSDIDRYALLRRHRLHYVQVTKEKLARPRSFVGDVHRELVAAGYDGEPPTFGQQWHQLFTRITDVLGPRRLRRTGGGGYRTVS